MFLGIRNVGWLGWWLRDLQGRKAVFHQDVLSSLGMGSERQEMPQQESGMRLGGEGDGIWRRGGRVKI